MTDDPYDLPLLFYWDIKDAHFLGVFVHDRAARSIATQAWLVCRNNPEQWISYSRNKTAYGRSRYRRTVFTYATTTRAIDWLSHEGWLEHDKAKQGQLGWQSRFRATPKLMAAISEDMATIYDPPEIIVLRDRKTRARIEYRETDAGRRMRSKACEINETIGSVQIAHPILGEIRTGSPTMIGRANPGPARQVLYRSFSGNFALGGRFYGGFWQGMKKEERQRLTMDGQPVSEPDYKAIHPTLLYAEAGVEIDGDDPYIINDHWPRKLVKVALNIMLNAKNDRSALQAIMDWVRKKIRDDGGMISPLGRHATALDVGCLMNAIRDRHKPVAHFFCSDAGIRLQHQDSRMAERVLLDMSRNGVCVLPIHDSFLVPETDEDLCREMMEKALEMETGKEKLFKFEQFGAKLPEIKENSSQRLTCGERLTDGETVVPRVKVVSGSAVPPPRVFEASSSVAALAPFDEKDTWLRERITALFNLGDADLAALFNTPRQPDEAQRMLAERVRSEARGRDVIFHGTRFARTILTDQRLKFALIGDPVICFSRSPETAAKWALMSREDEEMDGGAVLIFDRAALRFRFRLEPFHDLRWFGPPTFQNLEAEERVWSRDIYPVRSFLVGIVWEKEKVDQPASATAGS